MTATEESGGADAGSGPSVRALEPPIPKALFRYLINPLMKALLRSPLHSLVSDHLVSITFTGRKSGDEYTTPAGYERRGGTLYVTSQTNRVWWRNVRGGAPVTVWLRGERRRGTADVIEDDDAVAAYVEGFVDRHGVDAVGKLALSVEGDGLPDREALASALGDTVVVRIDLEDAA